MAVHQRLMDDFPFYAEKTLRIKPAEGGDYIPFTFNPAQRYADAVMNQQKKEKGWVRAVILKARRLGFSTYIAGRFYHRTATKPGIGTFILSHHSKTTQALFNMVKIFRKMAPTPIQPEISASNVYQMVFEKLGSEYAVGTAGSAEIGRGLTVQQFHGSEVAFWENTDQIVAGVLQTVQLLAGTEMVFESTGNGRTNLFYTMCMDAKDKASDYELIFAPWYWHLENMRALPIDFELTAEERELKSIPIDIPSITGLPLIRSFLTDEQIYWRRKKIFDFKNESDPVAKFKQEHPATVNEAFMSATGTLISPLKVAIARKTRLTDPGAPLLMGCDLARVKDRIVFVYRRGRAIEDYEVIPHSRVSDNPTNILTSMLMQRINTRGVAKCFIDYGHGHGVFDNLCSLGYNDVAVMVQFGESPLDKDKYANKRTEMIMLLRDYIHEGGVSIPDTDEFEIDLLCVPDAHTNERGLYALMPKDKIEKLTRVHCDILDAAALTFAYPVPRTVARDAQRARTIQLQSQGGSRIKTASRIQKIRTIESDFVSDMPVMRLISGMRGYK